MQFRIEYSNDSLVFFKSFLTSINDLIQSTVSIFVFWIANEMNWSTKRYLDNSSMIF